MTPEEKIVAAIDRNTAKIDEFRRDVGSVGMWLFLILIVLIAHSCPKAKAETINPPLDQSVLADIGTPPAPPPNPNLQYWYTADVPGPDGVFPVEVFAPRLVANMASDPGVVAWVEVPEPGTGMPLGIGLGCLVGYVYFTRKAQKKAARYRGVLENIAHSGMGRWELQEAARKALEE